MMELILLQLPLYRQQATAVLKKVIHLLTAVLYRVCLITV